MLHDHINAETQNRQTKHRGPFVYLLYLNVRKVRGIYLVALNPTSLTLTDKIFNFPQLDQLSVTFLNQ